ncbi:hypothetical protein OC835_000521 [Tilletia horrida]|nr:hypothetical protein OC835_000521 [Tilletia horrida]
MLLLSSLLSPSNPQSWSTFQRDVYRPRMALFLLALLLASAAPQLPISTDGKPGKDGVPQTPAPGYAHSRGQGAAGAGAGAGASPPIFGLSYSDFLFRPDKVIRRTSQHLFTNDAAAAAAAADSVPSASSPDPAAPTRISSGAAAPAPSYQTVSSPSASAAQPTAPAGAGARDKLGRKSASQPRPAPARPSQQHLEHPFKNQQKARPQSQATSRPSGSGASLHTISKPAQRADAPHNRSQHGRSSPARSHNATMLSMQNLGESLKAHRDDFVQTLQAGLDAVGLGSFTHPNVLPFLVLMHLMLGLRLTGMLLDDAINQELFGLAQHTGTSVNSLPRSQKSHRLLLASLASITALLSFATMACIPSLLDSIKDTVRVMFHFANPSIAAGAQLLPAQAILVLELLATTLSLVLPLYRLAPLVNSPRDSTSSSAKPAWAFPRTITLPSPSHSPPISEVLHLPEWICAIFDPRVRAEAEARARAASQSRRNASVSRRGSQAGDSRERVESSPAHAPGGGISGAPLVTALAEAALIGVPRRRLRRGPLGMAGPSVDTADEGQSGGGGSSSSSSSSSSSGPGVHSPLTLAMVEDMAARATPASPTPSPAPGPASSTPRSPAPFGASPASSSGSGASTVTVSGKSLRISHQHVRVHLGWFLEVLVSFFDRLVGALMYGLVVLRLPTLTPTSIYPLVALLALRNELGQMVQCWTRARQTVECLEFVRRRWGVGSTLRARVQALQNINGSGKSSSSSSSNLRLVQQAVWNGEEQTCAMCFEPTPTFPARSRSGSASEGPGAGGHSSADSSLSRNGGGGANSETTEEDALENTCVLDCAHVLHANCLVTWLRAQNFCPVCHAPLQGTPPGWMPTPPTTPGVVRVGEDGAGAGGGGGDVVAAGGIVI